jgi:hypothetical protein
MLMDKMPTTGGSNDGTSLSGNDRCCMGATSKLED